MTAVRRYAGLSLAREVAGLRGPGHHRRDVPADGRDLEVMAGDSLDPAKFAPVAARVRETVGQRLARQDVAARLAALG